MSCYDPRLSFKIAFTNGSVKVSFGRSVHSVDQSVVDAHLARKPYYDSAGNYITPLILPCGQCIGCLLHRSKQWAIRCVHEAQLHDENCFLTLTYDDLNLPSDGSLHKEHFQKFMKRLRKALFPRKIRFFACGEYGSQLNRPHYHAIIFGWYPEDKKLFSINRGSMIHVSPMLAKLWPFGFHTVGAVTFESAAYVARYVLKKHTGRDAQMHYDGLEPEFVLMSRKPGIARDWIEKFSGDVYPHDYVVIRDNIKCRPPRYYDQIYDDVLLGDMDYIRNKRLDAARSIDVSALARIEKTILTKIKKKEGKYIRPVEDI